MREVVRVSRVGTLECQPPRHCTEETGSECKWPPRVTAGTQHPAQWSSLVFAVPCCLWAAPHLSPLSPGFPLVVSLRQIQRKATREKERNQELRRLQDEARKEEGLRLTQRLQELERDADLMLVGRPVGPGAGGASRCGKGGGRAGLGGV